ncbi:MAG: class I SAM-dependent methyltransferase [Actinomycetota bacterium]|nr:class I SAM-dependent methyltransferase [Actinomycetota bacterium]
MPQRKQWEYNSPVEMQLALAGNWSREDYLNHRVELANELATFLHLDGSQDGFEIGSGEGIVARTLAAKCRSLDCTDISQTFLEAAESTCRDCANVGFHQIGTDFLDFLPAEQYDFGLSSNVFVHLNAYDIYFYLCSVRKILRPQGTFVFNVVSIGESNREMFHSQARVYRSHQDPIRTRGLMNWHGIDLIRQLVEEAGLSFDEGALRADSGGHFRVLAVKGASPCFDEAGRAPAGTVTP